MKTSKYLLLGMILFICVIVAGSVWMREDCRKKTVGEINAANIFIVKALTLLREGKQQDAFTVLETTVDLNVAASWEQGANLQIVSNTLNRVREYRQNYPQFSEYLKTNSDEVLQKRYKRAAEILAGNGNQ